MSNVESQLPPLDNQMNAHAAQTSTSNTSSTQSAATMTASSSTPAQLPSLSQLQASAPSRDQKLSTESVTAPATSPPSPKDKRQNTSPAYPNAKSTSYVTADGATTSKSNISSPMCKNCKTSTTPLWRRDESGQVLCNACGLFLKLHGRPRPISLKTDVIKSRNRVKHPGGGTINGTPTSKSGPNTPELKAKEQKKRTHGTKESSKKDRKVSPAPSQSSPPLVPLLPNGSNGSSSGSSSSEIKQIPKSPFMYSHLHHIPHHLQQQVPLHHPSSVPTQFASNLQTITSPLLLSTTPKNPVVHHQLAQTQAAAGVLENLSQDKREVHEHALPRSQLNPAKPEDSNTPFSPASALTANHKLPSLLNPISSFSYSSPSFGPQHSLTNPSAFSLANNTSTTQPSTASSLPPSSAPGTEGPSDENETVVSLKTRISELELVNDLYKSRISELESSEQQSRAREMELTRRIEELESFEQQRKKIKLEDGNVDN